MTIFNRISGLSNFILNKNLLFLAGIFLILSFQLLRFFNHIVVEDDAASYRAYAYLDGHIDDDLAVVFNEQTTAAHGKYKFRLMSYYMYPLASKLTLLFERLNFSIANLSTWLANNILFWLAMGFLCYAALLFHINVNVIATALIIGCIPNVLNPLLEAVLPHRFATGWGARIVFPFVFGGANWAWYPATRYSSLLFLIAGGLFLYKFLQNKKAKWPAFLALLSFSFALTTHLAGALMYGICFAGWYFLFHKPFLKPLLAVAPEKAALYKLLSWYHLAIIGVLLCYAAILHFGYRRLDIYFPIVLHQLKILWWLVISDVVIILWWRHFKEIRNKFAIGELTFSFFIGSSIAAIALCGFAWPKEFVWDKVWIYRELPLRIIYPTDLLFCFIVSFLIFAAFSHHVRKLAIILLAFALTLGAHYLTKISLTSYSEQIKYLKAVHYTPDVFSYPDKVKTSTTAYSAFANEMREKILNDRRSIYCANLNLMPKKPQPHCLNQMYFFKHLVIMENMWAKPQQYEFESVNITGNADFSIALRYQKALNAVIIKKQDNEGLFKQFSEQPIQLAVEIKGSDQLNLDQVQLAFSTATQYNVRYDSPELGRMIYKELIKAGHNKRFINFYIYFPREKNLEEIRLNVPDELQINSVVTSLRKSLLSIKALILPTADYLTVTELIAGQKCDLSCLAERFQIK